MELVMKLLLISAVLVSSCTLADLPTEDHIVRPRVLAIQAETPELRIGDSTRLRALVAVPPSLDNEQLNLTWIRCDERDRGGPGEDQDWCTDRSREQVLSRGDSPVITIPDDLPKGEVQQMSFVAGYWHRISAELRSSDGTHSDRAFKRIVVQPADMDPMMLAAMGNRNPTLPEIEVFELDKDGNESVAGEPMQANTDYLFRVAPPNDSRQDFRVFTVDLAGLSPEQIGALTPAELEERSSIDERRERLTLRHYRSDGKFGPAQGPNPTLKNTREAPEYYPAEVTWGLNTLAREDDLPETVRFWFILVDGRGGMSWRVVEKRFVQGALTERPAAEPPQPPPGIKGSR
jgi:hypothetical protein